LRNLGEEPRFDGAEFGVSVISPGKNLVSNGKVFYTGSKSFHGSRQVPTEYTWKLYGPPVLGLPGPFKCVYRVHACRCHAHQDFARLENRIGIVFVTKDLRSAIFVND
jgi:hypothetical protein